MKTKLAILERIAEDKVIEPNLRLEINIHLDKMILNIQKKLKTMEIRNEYSKEYIIDKESKLDEIFDDFYKDYLILKDIENYWSNSFINTEVIEFNLIEK